MSRERGQPAAERGPSGAAERAAADAEPSKPGGAALSGREPLMLGAAVAAIAFLFGLSRIFDNDVWWHLATGRWILQHGRVPTADPFSFATAGAPWVPHSWLAEVVMALAERAGGLDALVLLKAALGAAAFAYAFRALVRSGVSPWLAAFAIAAAAPVAASQLRERPAVAMFLLEAVFFWRLAAPGAETSRRTWAVLLPGMVVWANVHGSFFLGVVLAACLLADRLAATLVARARGEPGPGRRALLAAAGLVLALAAAVLVNPFGLGLPAQILRDFTGLAVTRTVSIQEHQPLDWRAYPGFAALALATLASFLAAGRRARPYHAAVFLCVNALALRSVRFAGVAALLDAGILALNLAPLAGRISARVPLAPRARAAVLSAALAGAVAAGFRAEFTEWSELRFGLGVNEARFPVGAVDLLERIGFEGNLFNTWDFGGYVLWRLPAVRDFVDGRTIPAQLELLERLYAEPDADAVARWILERDVRGALLLHGDAFGLLFQALPQFEPAYLDDKCIAYLRAGDPSNPLRGYRRVRLDALEDDRVAALALGPDAAEAEAELRRAVEDTRGAARVELALATFLEVRGRPGDAARHYLVAARKNPRLFFADPTRAARAARAALAAGDARDATWLARRALELHGGDPELAAVLAAAERAGGGAGR